MVSLVGFPKVTREAFKPGQVFVTTADGHTLFCLKGVHHNFVLLGHGRPPCRAWRAIDGPWAVPPGEVQLRPLRDRPWSMTWGASPSPGDLVIAAAGAFLCVIDDSGREPIQTTPALLDVARGAIVHDVATGPVFRGWELVCYPLPNRPMTLGSFDPQAGPAAQGCSLAS